MLRPSPLCSSRPAPRSSVHRSFPYDHLYTSSERLRGVDAYRAIRRSGVSPWNSTSPSSLNTCAPRRPLSAGVQQANRQGSCSAASPSTDNHGVLPNNNNSWIRRSAEYPSQTPRGHGGNTNYTGAAPLAAENTATLPALPRLSPYACPTPAAPTAPPPPTGASRDFSQPQSFTTPLRSSSLSTAASDAWTHLERNREELAAAAPFGLYEARRVSKPDARPPVQLLLSQLSVRKVSLQAIDAAVGPLLLRGVLGESSVPFCTDCAWPMLDKGGADDGHRADMAQTFAASWPATTVREVVSHASPTAPPRSVFCECYVNNTSLNSPLQLRSEAFVGRSVFTLEELIEAASVDVQNPNPVEVVLRDDSAAVVGRLSFAVALLPLPCCTVHVSDVAVLPDPLQADDGCGGAVEGRRRVPRAAVHEGELELSLVAPSTAVAFSDFAVVPADFRTPAVARWSALPPFCFYEGATGTAAEEDASAGQPHRSVPSSPWSGLWVIGELLYYPSSQQSRSRTRVLLGTFAIPGPASSAPLTTAPLYQTDVSSALSQHRPGPHASAKRTYPFQVPLHISSEGGRWMTVRDCWVRGVVETWTETTPSNAFTLGRGREARDAELHGRAAVPFSVERMRNAAASQKGEEGPFAPTLPPPRSAESSAERLRAQRVSELRFMNHTNSSTTEMATATATAVPSVPNVSGLSRQPHHLQHPSTTPSSHSPLPQQPSVPQEDAALQRVQERQQALIRRVEYRLAEVQRQRQHLKKEMATQYAQAAAEENAVLEEFGILESEWNEAETAYRKATTQLAELQQLHADRTADHDAYLAEQEQALEEVARERAEALSLRAQLETLQAQVEGHITAEQQRYASRAAIARADEQTRWLVEVEAKIAAAESQQ
ncbi:hypothetical protein ABL78_3641 [Leptomonas seymouri]|uniref:Uncharacterized protein n=1 Tax=Leptomonas seymouri TaxID=5684 RepID=A0A0N1PDM1_LEPSE|nr:hypothetical protein ABL78_3641 [Leptomonas seymouri]|eukprot:KPI87304.1 hypothetical protein ABL78_3641 [Leptomonas seymouri]